MNVTDFKILLDYYRKCFALIDVFHFNSNIAKERFELVLGQRNGKVVPIIHKSIKDNRAFKCFESKTLCIGFIGAEAPYKGLAVLKQVLSQIDPTLWRLDVWGGRVAVEKEMPIFYRGKYNQCDVSRVYENMDLLVVPSVWKETFSLVTIEALSFGVPVLVSDNVGAQDVVREYAPSFVYTTPKALLAKLRILVENRAELINYNAAILEKPWRCDMLSHAQCIINDLYQA